MNDTATTATVQALTAEVHALQVGSRQVTLSVFRQLDTIACQYPAMGLPEGVTPFGRVRDGRYNGLDLVGRHDATGALVRIQPRKPAWDDEAPVEFQHWLEHLRRLSAEEAEEARRAAGVAAPNLAKPYLARGHWAIFTAHRGRTLRWFVDDSDSCCDCPAIEVPDDEVTLNTEEAESSRRSPGHDFGRGAARDRIRREREAARSLELAPELHKEWRSVADTTVAYLVEREIEWAELLALPLIVLAGLR